MRPSRAGTAAAVLAEQRANMEFTGDLPGERVHFSRAVDEAVELLEEFVFVSHPVPVLALNEKGRSDIGSDEISAEELRDVDRALRHLHANLGHPGNRALPGFRTEVRRLRTLQAQSTDTSGFYVYRRADGCAEHRWH